MSRLARRGMPYLRYDNLSIPPANFVPRTSFGNGCGQLFSAASASLNLVPCSACAAGPDTGLGRSDGEARYRAHPQRPLTLLRSPQHFQKIWTADMFCVTMPVVHGEQCYAQRAW